MTCEGCGTEFSPPSLPWGAQAPLSKAEQRLCGECLPAWQVEQDQADAAAREANRAACAVEGHLLAGPPMFHVVYCLRCGADEAELVNVYLTR